ncbi:DNA breaking-rejoining enzyme [Panaeolus papilionaceus]|nr:DNA breaking-rejoining enzyme [Panaeolus papilionaceus]
MSDSMQKYTKAGWLKHDIDRIREKYTQDLESEIMVDQQLATAMYLIDKLGLGTGSENSGEDEAGMIGCCSLHPEHVTLQAPDWIIIDFVGKDARRYHIELQAEPYAYKNIYLSMEDKSVDGNLFDRLTTKMLDEHLASEVEFEGLNAQLFRIFNASTAFQQLLDSKGLENANIQEKLNAYHEANSYVADLYDHRYAAPQVVDKDTSISKCLDPRITIAWCKSHDVPIENLFSEELRTRLSWATDVDSSWKF